MSSRTELAETPVWAASRNGAEASSVTGEKSLSVSYGSFGYSVALTAKLEDTSTMV
jgi:hypothetical protein